MFSHVTVGSNDIQKSKAFYDALFKAAGGEEGWLDPDGGVVYVKDERIFIVMKPIDGKPATCANGGTVGFVMPSPEAVNSWHAAGTENGGVSVEDPPGIRIKMGKKLYLAYLRDPAGNKLCAITTVKPD
ncbi:VOC family protein [Ochrobactrum sp. CM-21-5]|nr:VOC family protein [Ochrobactrum sp. CM-21-5]MBC2885469.1 VOC family protein [Ochrobactrum sp. CM-21-5]